MGGDLAWPAGPAAASALLRRHGRTGARRRPLTLLSKSGVAGRFRVTVAGNSRKIPFVLLLSAGIKNVRANTTNENAPLIRARAA